MSRLFPGSGQEDDMNAAQALVFGLIQGLTEFLPVSSSGHLLLMKRIFGLEQVSILFDILLHLATLLAVLIVFRSRLGKLISSLIHAIGGKMDDEDQMHLRLIAVLMLATVITAILGIGIDSILKPAENIKLVSLLFIVTAVILLVARGWKPGTKGYREMGLREALLLGSAQGLGVFPGISRSGITISAGIMAGLNREEAGEFSFLLSIPAILGAALLRLRDLGDLSEAIGSGLLLLGMASSFISGLIALLFFMHLIKRGKLFYFAFYLIPLGVLGLLLL